MAENPDVSDAGNGRLVPTPFPGESLLCSRRGMQLYVSGVRGRKWKAKGSLFLTSVRMVFIANKPDVDGLAAFDLPLVYLRNDKFNQPIFGCNNLSGECWPVCEGGGPMGSMPPHQYQLFFLEGGVGTFLPLYFTFITAAREADRNQRQAGGPGGAGGGRQKPQAEMQTQMNQAFVDPDDPTAIYLTQPVSQTTAQAPVYAKNYGQDEKYESLI